MNVSSYDVAYADRGTDAEIIYAILELAKDKDDFQRIWEAPTEEEEASVVKRAWELADDDEDTLYWGEWRSVTR